MDRAREDPRAGDAARKRAASATQFPQEPYQMSTKYAVGKVHRPAAKGGTGPVNRRSPPARTGGDRKSPGQVDWEVGKKRGSNGVPASRRRYSAIAGRYSISETAPGACTVLTV